MPGISVAIVGVCLLSAGGCGPPGRDLYAKLQDEDPAVRLAAIHRAGQTRDQAAVPYLVDRLSDSERDVRFFAVLALKRIAGKTMGWKHYAPPAERAKAVRRWRRWLENRRTDAPETQETEKDR